MISDKNSPNKKHHTLLTQLMVVL